MKSLRFTRSPLCVALAPWRFIPSVIISGLALVAAPQAGAVMMDLGNLPGASGTADAQAISGDGKVVAGTLSNGSTYMLFRWSAENGISSLGSFSTLAPNASAVSADGRYIVGTIQSFAGGYAARAFRWDAKTGFVDIGSLTPSSISSANGVSDDGTVVVGSWVAPGAVPRAFRWTQAGGAQALQGLETEYANVNGVSGDGTVVVGKLGSGDNAHAFRWSAQTNSATDLGILTGYSESSAKAANRNGSVVVGSSKTATSSQAFRWSTTKGLQGLGTLGGNSSTANDVDASGAVVVGASTRADNVTRAFRWTAATGMEDLGALSGASDSVANSVSDDGLTVVGNSGARAFIWTTSQPVAAEAGLPDPGLPFGVLQDLANLQRSDITSATTLAQLTATQTRRIRDLSSQQCIPGSAQQYCLSAGLGANTGEAGTRGKQGITQAAAGMRLNEQFSIGGNLNLASADLHSESAKQDSAFGLSLWAAYQQHPDNLGWQGSASVAAGTSDNTFERGVALTDVQRARASTRLNSTALRVAAGYGIKIDSSLVTPEMALSHARSESGSYTERNVAFPLTLNGARSNDTYATLAVRSETPLSPKATLHLGVAVDALLSDNTDAISGHSQVPGLSNFTLNNSLDKRSLVPVASVGYSYALDANSSVAAQVQAGTSVYEAQGPVYGVGVQYRYAF